MKYQPAKYNIGAATSPTRSVREAAVEAPPMPAPASMVSKPVSGFYGFHPILAGGKPVTNELVNDLRQESGV